VLLLVECGIGKVVRRCCEMSEERRDRVIGNGAEMLVKDWNRIMVGTGV